ncbi:hypothetical protein [Martelella limonii]|uniref:hypothetical protein n=1 Tax=Martelella limonii TaxID=1647649 RepID=UPI0015812659|nr:hypothetical protein [Martelella limonii]
MTKTVERGAHGEPQNRRRVVPAIYHFGEVVLTATQIKAESPFFKLAGMMEDQAGARAINPLARSASATSLAKHQQQGGDFGNALSNRKRKPAKPGFCFASVKYS